MECVYTKKITDSSIKETSFIIWNRIVKKIQKYNDNILDIDILCGCKCQIHDKLLPYNFVFLNTSQYLQSLKFTYQSFEIKHYIILNWYSRNSQLHWLIVTYSRKEMFPAFKETLNVRKPYTQYQLRNHLFDNSKYSILIYFYWNASYMYSFYSIDLILEKENRLTHVVK